MNKLILKAKEYHLVRRVRDVAINSTASMKTIIEASNGAPRKGSHSDVLVSLGGSDWLGHGDEVRGVGGVAQMGIQGIQWGPTQSS